MAHDIFKIPNLITLGRLLLLIPTAYFLSKPGVNNQVYALACLTVAAISDYLDGFFARLLNQRTRLGLLLDPLSDKILAGTLVILLIIYRDFPLWLAAVIVGRDLLILIGGLAVKSKITDVPSSNLSGKYSFATTAVLLCSYIIEFDFGIWLFTIITVAFIILSLIMYGRTLVKVMQGQTFPKFQDKTQYRIIRVAITWIISIYFLYRLGQDIGWL
jgi:CDP-diacylglycerol--glycerol-3-phosphate 3-phosphatidyltransferase